VPYLRRTRPDSRALSYQFHRHPSLAAYFACLAEAPWLMVSFM